MHQQLKRLPVVPDEIEGILFPDRAIDVQAEVDAANIEAV